MTHPIKTPNAPSAIGPYSQAVCTGTMLFVSGQLPIDPFTGDFPSGGIAGQTRQSLENIRAIITEAGFSFSDVVKTTVFLADISDFAAMNEVYATYFTAPYPARAAFEVGNLPKNAKVEIEVIAVK